MARRIANEVDCFIKYLEYGRDTPFHDLNAAYHWINGRLPEEYESEWYPDSLHPIAFDDRIRVLRLLWLHKTVASNRRDFDRFAARVMHVYGWWDAVLDDDGMGVE